MSTSTDYLMQYATRTVVGLYYVGIYFAMHWFCLSCPLSRSERTCVRCFQNGDATKVLDVGDREEQME